MSEVDKKYLIRSSGLILGPFSREEVIDRIKRGSISIFDEAAEPFSIWLYLQDHEDFKQTVSSMDFKSRLTNFVTQISGKISTLSQKTQTEDKTASQTKEVLSGAGLAAGEKKEALEAQFEMLEESAPSAPRGGAKLEYASQEAGEEAIRKKAAFIIKVIWRLIIASALLLAGYILYKEAVIPFQKQRAVERSLKTEGFQFYEAGNYKRALPYFEKAYAGKKLSEKEKLLLGGMFLQEGKPQRALSLSQELAGGSLQRGGSWFLFKGLMSFFQNDFSASEAHFKKALLQEERAALLNLSILKWASKDDQASLSYLNRLIETGYERDFVFYLKALNLLSQNESAALSDYIKKDLALGQSFSLAKEYQQELYFLLAYAEGGLLDIEGLRRAVESLLNQDPFFYLEYKYSPFLAVKSLGWSRLLPYCKKLFAAFKAGGNLLSALHGFCHLKANNLKEGSKLIAQVKNSEPENPLFLSLYAYMLLLKGEELQAEQALNLIDYQALEPNQMLPYILKARLFEGRGDWARALKAWENLLSLQMDYAPALAGAAAANYELGYSAKASVYSEKALAQHPYNVKVLSYKEGEAAP